MLKQLLRTSAVSALLAPAVFLTTNTQAQSTLDGRVGVPGTAVPFLRISPDARSGAMGDVGIAISPDANAQYWNVAKVAASDKIAGVSITYTPWLKDITPDVFLMYLSGYYRFGKDTNQAVSGSVRYFSLGDLEYRDGFGMPTGTGKPTEMAVDLGYSRRLTDEFSIGANLRYIYSNIAAGAQDPDMVYSAANAFATDIGVFYSRTKTTGDDQSQTFAAGAVITNLGNKISYTQQSKDFLPATLGIGAAYTQQVDMYSKFTVALDLNKAVTPSPVEKIHYDQHGNETGRSWDKQENLSVVQGFFKSFGQAPKGYGTTISVGGEYWYQDQFAARAGYFYETPENGNRQYFTVGLGVKYSVFGLNFSYLVPSGNSVTRNPLSNTLRFSLTFDFDHEKLEEGKRNRARKKREAERESKQQATPQRITPPTQNLN